MQITGANLQRVLDALDLADAELQNQIGMWTDEYKDVGYLEDLEAEREDFAKLRARVARAIEREDLK